VIVVAAIVGALAVAVGIGVWARQHRVHTHVGNVLGDEQLAARNGRPLAHVEIIRAGGERAQDHDSNE
jgi:hypothetical protein